MKKYILIPLLILSNFVLGQDTITYKYNVDLTGTINNANDNRQNNIVLSTFNSVNWKKFETGMSTNYQLSLLFFLGSRRTLISGGREALIHYLILNSHYFSMCPRPKESPAYFQFVYRYKNNIYI